jgi:hypothetical protein
MSAPFCVAWLAAGLLAGQPARPVVAKTEIAQPEQPVVKRAAMQQVEKTIDARLETASPADPFDLLGDTRGVYVQGFGVVLTSEVDLVRVPGISPFHQTIGAEERVRIHARKLLTLLKLREAMRAALISAASELRAVPLNENIVYGVTLFYYVAEDTGGLPSQIIMQATRQQLVTNPNPDSIKVQEF